LRQTITQLSQLSGLDRKTVAARLADAGIESLPDSPKQVKQYESADALPALYVVNGDSGEVIKRERGRVLAAQAIRQELKLQLERGEVLSTRKLYDFMAGLSGALLGYRGTVLPVVELKGELTPEQMKVLDDEIDLFFEKLINHVKGSINELKHHLE
jgi:hypothetical protein